LSQTATIPRALRPALPGVTVRGLQKSLLWAAMAAGFFVKIEPAPVDLLMVAVIIIFMFTKSRVSFAVTPLIVFLLLYNLGGFISFLEISSEFKATMFVVTSIYMAVSAIVIAIIISGDPVEYVGVMRNGWIIAGVIAAAMGLAGYFNVAGTGETLSLYGRAVGGFKDPNVFSTFLVAPAVFLVHGFLIGKQRWPLVSAVSLLLILAALFLAFSRGAWVSVVFASLMATFFTFALTGEKQMRVRIVILTVLGIMAAVAALALLLSIEQVRTLFLDRFTLVKDYDGGETGRFGTQLNSIPILLERPLGFGPTFFRRIFLNDPHNVYLNAFAAYGWLGGVTYPLLVISSIVVGLKSMMTRTPFQHFAIAVWCPMVSTMFQGVQIDTDHWRHFYLLVGMTWGLYGATVIYKRDQAMALRM
jgi:O-Antigen ligase